MEGTRSRYADQPLTAQNLNYRHTDETPVQTPVGQDGGIYPSEQPRPIYDGKWDISIVRMDHGYMVHVGCKKFAIESKHSVLKALDAYLSNPEKVAQDYLINGNLPL